MEQIGARVRNLCSRWQGHLQTVGPGLIGDLREDRLPAEEWTATIPNEYDEPIVHTGAYIKGRSDQVLVVILHGLGGHIDRGYCLSAAMAAKRQGLSSLRLALRGADGQGADIHHAGLTSDLETVLKQSPLQEYDRIALMGYSLGGHVALSAAVRAIDARLAATVAICPPLDLSGAQRRIDGSGTWVYREYILRALKGMYRRLVELGYDSTPVDRVERCRSLREWDALTVVPRFGFRDVDEYYASQSVGPKLGEVASPTLVISSPDDPMIPSASIRPFFDDATKGAVDVRWVRGGGHVYFPSKADLGFGATGSVEDQAMDWIARQVGIES